LRDLLHCCECRAGNRSAPREEEHFKCRPIQG
jgi:hypothetical protein